MKILVKSFWLEVKKALPNCSKNRERRRRKKKIRNVTKRLVSISPLFFDRDDEEHVDDEDDDDGSSSGTSWHDLSNATFPRIRGGAARYRKEKGRNETGFLNADDPFGNDLGKRLEDP